MPEYPEITVYIERLEDLIEGQILEQVRFTSPFLLRTAEPPIDSIKGAEVQGFERIGKRIVFVFAKEYFLVLHLMVSGRLHWRKRGCVIPAKIGLAALDFPSGSLLIQERGSRKRASMHLVRGREDLAGIDPGGLELLVAPLEDFREALTMENHTLKRALTDPRILSGIGNAFSDEILHRARLSPLLLTQKLTHIQIEQLFNAGRATLVEWTQRLREEVGNRFPENVNAYRNGMAVHGRYRKPCPDCGTPIQRIRYAFNETNYCPRCQTGGKLLADRALSRLLKKDWPRTIEELETMKRRQTLTNS
jgi:formamidopyrimidine-DNA glycosylase